LMTDAGEKGAEGGEKETAWCRLARAASYVNDPLGKRGDPTKKRGGLPSR